MKSFKRILSLIGAAAILTSALAVNAAAEGNVPVSAIKPNTSSTSVLTDVPEVQFTETGYYFDGCNYYYLSSLADYYNYYFVRGSGVKHYDTSFVGSIVKPETSTLAGESDPNAPVSYCYFNNGIYTTPIDVYDVICGGRYYTNSTAQLNAYFANKSYSLTMSVGEERVLSENFMFISLDESVASWNAETGVITANAAGTTTLYVYTESGLPFMSIQVTVNNKKPVASQITLIPDEYILGSIGDKIGFVVKSPSKYSDIVLDIVSGTAYARLSEGKLIAKGYGPVVVRAYSKSNPLIYGETVVYVGKYTAPVYDGYWYTSGNDICVNPCPYTFWNNPYSYINGWICSAEGIMLPVIKVHGANVIRNDGTIESTIAVSANSFELYNLLLQAYANKDEVDDILKYYYGFNRPVVYPGGIPVVKPDCNDNKPDFKPDYKPDFKPDYKPDCKPDVEPGEPGFKPGDHTKPIVKPGTPGFVPGDHTKPIVKPGESAGTTTPSHDYDAMRLFVSQLLGSILGAD